MLLNFKVKNYLSFKDEAWFSMESNKKIRTLYNNKKIIKLKDWENIWLNKTAVFYWANASWKTNILKWLKFLKDITLDSFKYPIDWWIKHKYLKSFLLDKSTKDIPIEFEIIFLIKKVKYEYILKLNRTEIINEKLVFFNKNKKIPIIIRKKDNIFIWEDYLGFKQDDFFKNNLYPRNNQTFISKISDFDSKWEFLSTNIVKFFKSINFIGQEIDLTWLTLQMLDNKDNKKSILNFMIDADNNIENIKQEEKDFNIFKNNNKPFLEINWTRILPDKVIETAFIHPIYNNKEKVWNIWFNLNEQESLWTQKLFSLLWPILDTINWNWILLIDEIDTHMHFLLVENLINFFHWLNNEWKNNIWNSQFIFNTHNLDLMDLELFRKDQIYFTSKDYYWSTEIYSLNDFKDMQIRNNSDIKKAYKLWIFWAIPILNNFNI